MKYSLERKESVLKKLLPPESRLVAEVSEEGRNLHSNVVFSPENSANTCTHREKKPHSLFGQLA